MKVPAAPSLLRPLGPREPAGRRLALPRPPCPQQRCRAPDPCWS